MNAIRTKLLIHLRRTCAVAVVAAFALASGAPAAHAQETPTPPPDASETAAARALQVENRYAEATRALDEGRYRHAVDLFRQLVQERSARQDAALYWIAYAQHRQGQRADALRTLAELRAGFPASSWLDDARYLETEIRSAAGQQIDPERLQDDEMRLHALNALLHVDPERALPVIERILRGDDSPEMKERALFVLLQGDGSARDLLDEIARDESTEPELRRMALQHVGMMGGEESLELLDEVYRGTDDRELREMVLHGYMMAGDQERLLRVAREESDEEMRVTAIHGLAMAGGGEELWALYEAESSSEAREAILHSMAMSGEAERLLEIARSESDPALRRQALEALIMVQADVDQEALRAELRGVMLEAYRGDDPELRDAAVHYFWMHGDAATLIELFEQEDDLDRKRRIVEALSRMESDEAVDFLMRLIER